MKSALLVMLAPSLAVAADPIQARLDFARGVLEESRGAAAEEWFEQALKNDPAALPLVHRVSRQRWQDGDIEGASLLLREQALARPESIPAQVEYADFLRESSPQDDFAAGLAVEVLEAARERHGPEPSLVRRLFRAYEQRGEREKSLALFDQTAAEPGRALLAADMARTLFDSDDATVRERLDELFRKAMAETPADAALARAASEHFRKSGRSGDAAEILAAHAEAAPASLELRVRLGLLQLSAKREAEGEATLREVLEIDSRQALAHQALAKLHRNRDEPELARPHAAEVLKIRGGDASEFLTLADEWLEAGEPRQARLLLEKGVFDHPDDAALAVRLAIATRRDPETRASAARLFREAEALSGTEGPADEPEFLREFAECLLESGETAAAEERLRTAIRAYPAERKKETAAALRRLAEIWDKEGRNQSASRSLKARADSLDP